MNSPDQPPSPPTLDPADPRSHFATALATMLDTIGGIAVDQMERPTPCEGMDVTGLLGHQVNVVRRVACAGRDDELSTWPVDEPDTSPADAIVAIRSAAHEVQAAWTDEVLERPTSVPWGQFPGAAVLSTYTNEVTVHTWDLATATGQSVDWSPEVLETSWVAINEQLPMADRTPMWDAITANLPPGVEWVDPFGPAVDVADDAPLIDRLVAWNGRTP